MVSFSAFVLLAGCERKPEVGETAEVQAVASAGWTCEEHWLVANVVKELQTFMKRGGTGAGEERVVFEGESRVYRVGSARLKLFPSCWDLASYGALLEAWHPARQTPRGPAPELLRDLLSPTAGNLQKANEVVSARLNATPAAPEPHEEAAFLLGVFGLRENAREFGDRRLLLCKMTAHLALAECLRGGERDSVIGAWAKVLFNYHAGRPVLARGRLQNCPEEGDSGRWRRAMECFVTGDWRRTQEVDDPSLLEALAHARALQVHRGNDAMMEFVRGRKDLQAIPDWSRMLSGPGKSVQEGHVAMRVSLPMEFQEMGEVFKTGKNPRPKEIAAFLGEGKPAEDGALRVISDADWAAYFRRHFFMACGSILRFAERQWASHEAAVEWESQVLPYCRALPDHELIEPLLSTNGRDYQEDLRKAVDYIRCHPERVPMGLWFDYKFPHLEGVSVTVAMPDQVPWFREVSPPGTAHDPHWRIHFSGISNGSWRDHMKALHELDPWNAELCYELAENTGNDPDSIKAAWGEVREYSIRPLRQTLESPKLTHEGRIEALRLLSTFEPEAGLDLGDSLVVAGRPDEAFAAYETAYENAQDRVKVANHTRWLIYYYQSRGQSAKAREVADHNEKVYSHDGLASAFALAIHEKDKRAHRLARAIAERYEDDRFIPLAAWVVNEDQGALRRIFPEGIREVSKAEAEQGKSFAGCKLLGTSWVTNAVGLKRGDVILAVDGKRVENYQQFCWLMNASLDPCTRFIYRRAGKVMELECQLPERRVFVEVRGVAD
jgi:hypothetical protein